MLNKMILIALQNTEYTNVIHICEKLKQTMSMLHHKWKLPEILSLATFCDQQCNSLTLLKFPDPPDLSQKAKSCWIVKTAMFLSIPKGPQKELHTQGGDRTLDLKWLPSAALSLSQDLIFYDLFSPKDCSF